MSQYPSIHQIEDIFHYRLWPNTLDKFEAYLAPDVNVTIAGQNHRQADKNLTKGDFIKEIKRTMDPLQTDNFVNREIIKVVGGGDSPWAAVECRISGKTKTGNMTLKHFRLPNALLTNEDVAGRKYHHEWVYMVRFNTDGKIATIRTYIDSAHITHHIGVSEGLYDESADGTLNLAKSSFGSQTQTA